MLVNEKLFPSFLKERGTRFKALFALGMVCFFWGTTWVVSKEAVRYMPALQMAGIRQLLGGTVYIIFFISKGIQFPKGKQWWPIIVLGFLNFVLSNGLSTWGVQYITAGLGSIIGAIFPLWIVIIGFFRSASKVPVKAVIGLLVGFAGICIIFYGHLNDFLNPNFRLGILFSITATWSWAFGTLYTKKKAKDFNPYLSLGLQMFISGIALLCIVYSTGLTVPLDVIPWQSWSAIAYLVVFGSVISFIAYLYALQHLPTEQVSIYAYMNPVVAVVLGSMIFHEKLTVFIAMGGLVTLYGVYLVNKVFRESYREEIGR